MSADPADVIHTSKTSPEYIKRGGYRAVLSGVAMIKHGSAPNFAEVDEDAPALYAWVCRGMWVITCPICRDGYIADPDDDLYWCPTCENVAIGGKARRITWPKASKRRNVERILRARPDKGTRNYCPDEDTAEKNWYYRFKDTAQSLRDENTAHGHDEFVEPLEDEEEHGRGGKEKG